MNFKRHNLGFSLLEVLVVFSFIALILTIVPPFLPNVIANSQIKSATREISANLKKTRSLAITKQEEMTMNVNIENKTYIIDNIKRIIKLPDTASLSLITAKSEQVSNTEGQIRFFPDGSSTGGQIKLAYDKQNYFIDINWLTGKIKIEP